MTALTSPLKAKAVICLGADSVVTHDDDPGAILGENPADLVIDNVAGAGFPVLLWRLRRGGRYASSGVIAEPIVSLDLRDMHLKDITMLGATAWDEPAFAKLIRYIEAGEIRPILAGSWSLADIVAAQTELVRRAHVGNFVLVPPPLRAGVPSRPPKRSA